MWVGDNMWFTLRYLCLATVVLCLEQPRVQNERVKQSFHFRRAIDGTRGRKYFNPYQDGSYDSYGSAGGYYDSSQVQSGFSNIRSNVPGEPGVDYPVYERVPKTRFSCDGRSQGYYADEDAGCQAFHVCHNVVISSFICPVGSIFSQKLLTCDWWSKVDCGTTGAYISRQVIHDNDNEMVQKAYAMTQLSNGNIIKTDPQINIRGMKTVDTRFRGNGAGDFSGRESFAAPRGRETQYYSNNPTKQPGIHESFGFGRNQAVIDDKSPSQKNIINVNLRPKNYEVNHQVENSRFNNGAQDSSIFYIQKNVNTNSRGSYTTVQPPAFENIFQNSYQQSHNIFRNEFQPSYAPTVPTVTTTTRRLYSPTVPTTIRPSTISYNKYDQYSEGSDHLYTHSRNTNFFTTRSTIDYGNARVGDDRFKNPINLQRQTIQQSGNADRTAANKGLYEDNFAAIDQAQESIGIVQSYGGRLNNVGNNSGDKANIQNGANLQLEQSKKQDTYLLSSKSNRENTTAQLGAKPTSFISNVSGNQQNYQHFYSNRLARARNQDEQVTEKVNSVSANNYTQAYATVETRNEKSLNLNNSDSGISGISPLIVQIPRPLGLSGRPVTDIADQLFTYDSFIKMSSSNPQSASPVETPKMNFTNVINRVQSENPSTKIPDTSQSIGSSGTQSSTGFDDETIFGPPPIIPPLISQSSQSAAPSGTESPTAIEDNTTFGGPSRIPSLISQNSQSVETSEVLTNVDDETQSFVSSTRIPSLTSQSSQSAASSGAQSSTGFDDETIFGSPPIIPPLIAQNAQSVDSSGVHSTNVDGTQSFDSPTGIPPLISQSSQSAASSAAESTSVLDDNKTFDSPSKIPPLTSQISQSSESPGNPTNVGDETQSFVSSTRIPSLMSQSSQSAASSGAQSSTDFDDETIFGSPPIIPPLIPQNAQSVDSSGVHSTNVDGTQSFDSPTGIPPLISQSSQSVASSGADSTSVLDDNKTFDSPSKIPPLISQISQSSESPGNPINVGDKTQSFASSTRIPPLMSQSSQSAASSGAQSSTDFDDETIFGSPPIIPPLIPQNAQSIDSSGAHSTNVDGTQSFDSLTRIPPLISQSSQSTTSLGAESTSVMDDNKTFDLPPRIPPLISQISQPSESSGVHVTNADKENQTFDSPTKIPPLISQSSQSAGSLGAQSTNGIDDNKTSDSPPRIPSLISQISQSGGSSGDLINVGDRMQSFASSTRIPPLISQSTQSIASSGVQSSTVFDDETIFGSAPIIPPLISQISQSVDSPGVHLTSTDDETQSFDSSTRIPPLIPQISQSGGLSGVHPTNADQENQTFDSLTKIPPLISQSSQSAASSGAHSTSVTEDNKTFNSPSNIPPLISQISQSSGSLGDLPNVGDGIQSFVSSTRIPPLISQASQSTASSGAQSSTLFDDATISDSLPKIPPLIPQNAQSVDSSAANPTNVDGIQSFDSPTKIPPLISQSSQSAATSGAQSTNGIDDNTTFDSPPRIPSLISQISQSGGSSGDLTNVGDRMQSFASSIIIPPLIPQNAQSVESSGIDRTQSFDSPTKIPPLISQSAASSGAHPCTASGDKTIFDAPPKIPSPIPQNSQSVESSVIHSTNVDGAQSFDLPTRIPPLISQSSQFAASSGAESTSVMDDNKTFDSPSKIPPLTSQISQSSESPGNFPPRIPPLISQISQSGGSSGVHLTNVNDGALSFDLPTRIPPLISQSSQSMASSGALPPTVIDNNKKFSSSSRVPPLIPQNSQFFESSVLHFTNVDGTQTFDSSTKIPPLIPSTAQSASSSGERLPTVIDDDKTSGSSPTKPPLISQFSQFMGSSEVHSTNVDTGTQTVESSTRIPSLISQFSQSTVSSGVQFPSVIDDKNTLYRPPKIQPSTSQTSQFIGSPGINLPQYINRTHTFISSSGISQSISQNYQPIGSSNIYPTYGFGGEHISYTPQRIPPLISQISRPLGPPGIHSTNILHQQQSLFSSDKRPSLISRPADSSAPYSNNPFHSSNVLPTTTEGTYFTFQGQYERPLPFSFSHVPTQSLFHQFGATPTTKIPAYNFNQHYGLKLKTETSTIRPFGGLVDSADKTFRIHVPDFPSTEMAYSTQSTILSTPKNPNLSGVSSLKPLDGQSSSVNDMNEKSSIVSSNTEQTTVQAPEVSHLQTSDYQESSVTEVSNIGLDSLQSKNHSFFPILPGNNVNEHSHTEIKVPTLTLPIPDVPHSNFNIFKQDPTAIWSTSDPQRPILQHLGPGAQLYPTATPFPFAAISSTYLPQSAESPFGASGQKVVDLENSNVADSEAHLSHPENLPRKEYQENTTPHTFHRVTSVENNLIPTASQSPFDNFGYSKERFESNTSKNVLETTNIKSTENLNPSSGGLLQSIGTNSLPSDLASSFVQIEASLNNNNDSPLELHFTVNADEDFNPSADFISKLLAQHGGDSSLGPEGFGGFEIIKSDSPGGLDDKDDVKPTPLPSIEPSVTTTAPRLLFDVRGSFADQLKKPNTDFTNQNSNSGTPILTASKTRPTGLEQPKHHTSIKQPNHPPIIELPNGPTGTEKSNHPIKIEQPSHPARTERPNGPTGLEQLNHPTGIEQPNHPARIQQSFDFPRPFFVDSSRDVALQSRLHSKFDDVSITNSPHLDSNVQREQLPNGINLPKLRVEAKDINRSLESLFEIMTTESSPLMKEQILEQLTKHFGQPLYNGNSQGNFVPSEASHTVDYSAGQQFANLEQYRVGKNKVSDREPEPTNPSPPGPSTTTTPEPVKTIVETEFIPSLSFSFDSDDGRNEYVEAVLRGLLTEHRPVYPWDLDANFYRETRENSKSGHLPESYRPNNGSVVEENSKSSNDTTEV